MLLQYKREDILMHLLQRETHLPKSLLHTLKIRVLKNTCHLKPGTVRASPSTEHVGIVGLSVSGNGSGELGGAKGSRRGACVKNTLRILSTNLINVLQTRIVEPAFECRARKPPATRYELR